MRLPIDITDLHRWAILGLLAACSSSGASGGDQETGESSDDGTDACVPGQSIACECDDGRGGAQVCEPDGTGYDECACGGCEVVAPRVGLQRLTRAEYNRTVRDLFGVTSNPADGFPPDSSTNGFDNNAKSLTASPQLAELLLDTAEDVADEAMTTQQGEIIFCDPGQDADCARTTLSALALRVYRRPATADELDDAVDIVFVIIADTCESLPPAG